MQTKLLNDTKTKKNLTNRQIADMAQISESTVSRILSDKTGAKFEDVIKIAVALDLPINEVAGIARQESEEIQELREALAEKDAKLAIAERIVRSHDQLLEEKDRNAAYLKSIIRILVIGCGVLLVLLVGESALHMLSM